tara:strand:+ start:187 stop:636 length:450 start_codon:yes stop_codon:yes gene_type:complete
MKNTILYIVSLTTLVVILFIFKIQMKKSDSQINTGLNKSSITKNKPETEILNGCGQTGVANLFTHFLRAHNYDVIEIKNADHFNYEKTSIKINNESNLMRAKELVNLLAVDEVNILIDKKLIWDLSVIIGNDYKNLSSFNEIKKYYEPF